MRLCCKVAIIVVLAMTTNLARVQIVAGQPTVPEVQSTTQQPAYASITDKDGADDEARSSVYETLSDQAETPEAYISAIGDATTPRLTAYPQAIVSDDYPLVDDTAVHPVIDGLSVTDTGNPDGVTADVELDDVDDYVKGVRNQLYDAPEGSFRQMDPDTFYACDSCGDVACHGCEVAADPGCCGQGVVGCPECCSAGPLGTTVYGQFLYLRPRNADVAYAVPVDGPILAPPANVPLQLGGLGIIDPDYEPGFRAGFNLGLDESSSFDVSYSMFESYTSDQIVATTPPLVLLSLVAHPSSTSAITNFVSARAELEIDFDVIDASYRHRLICRDLFAASYVMGARYAKLEQQFDSLFIDGGTETVRTDIDFDGAGLRLGLETERHSCRRRLHVFANGYASFLAGRFRGSYFQGQSFDPVVVDTNWEAGRVVPILELEMGLGWTSQGGRLRVAGGYQVSAWFNTLKTQEFIHAIQGSHYADLGRTMTFDGLSVRAEFRF